MSSSRDRPRRRAERENTFLLNNEQEEAIVVKSRDQTRVVYDFTENQLLAGACCCLVFLSIVALFGVLLFTILDSDAADEPLAPLLSTCFGVIGLAESDQLATICSRTSVGSCATTGPNAVGLCIFGSHANDISLTDLPSLRSCQDETCVGVASACSCVAEQVCTRTLPSGTAQFDCRAERVCGSFSDIDRTEIRSCSLDNEVFGECNAADRCEYRAFSDGAAVIEGAQTRSCEASTPCQNVGDSCTCKDLVCEVSVDQGDGPFTTFMECL